MHKMYSKIKFSEVLFAFLKMHLYIEVRILDVFLLAQLETTSIVCSIQDVFFFKRVPQFIYQTRHHHHLLHVEPA